ncbi:MAG: family 20 glycosylhydrolase [Chloroflexi bacterium]|nr:family 20 glycosylhydrolase [Chloroflexota bacterium]
MSLLQVGKALLSFALLPFYTASRPTNRITERPHTIPALKEWTGGIGTYTFGAYSRIVLDSDYASHLEGTGDVFAEDLQQLTGLKIPVVSSKSRQPSDMVLTLNATDTIPGDEGYCLEVADCVTISAQADHGAFYGTRTILQLLKQGLTIKCGMGRDWPDHPQRSLMVDMGRKYFSLSWLESHIRDLAYLKYNYFHFHLSDNFGFRLESERHPEIVSQQHYTKRELRALIELAQKYHITIVPEIDMPGHMDAILESHPELQLCSSSGQRRKGDIDLANDVSYKLMQDLLEEYLPLFPGPYWHIGADEYLMAGDYAHYPQLETYAQEHYGTEAIARDSYLGFVNWANEIIKSHGKITRAWNDGLHGGKAVTVATDIVCEHWYGQGLTPQEIVDFGLYIMNGNADHLYYVPGLHWQARADGIYETFETHIFHNEGLIKPLDQKHLGAKLHVWCDDPDKETEHQIADGIRCSLRSLAQKNWGSAKLVTSYDGFVPIINRIGRAPGYVIALLPDESTLTGPATVAFAENLSSLEYE